MLFPLLLVMETRATQRFDDYPLTMQGLGALRIGMPEAQFKTLGLTALDKFPPTDDPDSHACNQVTLKENSNIGLMFENRILTRIEIYGGKLKSLSGIGVGSSESEAQAVYGKGLLVEPHEYDPTGRYLKLFSSDGKYAMTFETDGRKITEFRSGFKDPAQYVEGCL